MAEDAAYQCKLCGEKFKITADLQKHKRIKHRNVGNDSSKPDNARKPTEVEVELASKDCAKEIRQDFVSKAEGETSLENRPRTRSSCGKKVASNQNRKPVISNSHTLPCVSCGNIFDMKDAVVLHLLRQSRNDKGVHQCPFCAKTIKSESLVSVKNVESNNAEKDSNKRSGSGRNGIRRSVTGVKKMEETTPNPSVSNALPTVEPQVLPASNLAGRPQSSRIRNKRQLNSSQEESTTSKNIKLDDSVLGQSESSADSLKPTPINFPPLGALTTPLVSFTSSFTGSPLSEASTSSVPVRAFQTDQIKRDYEITYRQPRGKGSRGGIGGRRTSGNTRHSSADNVSQNHTDPLKVSVLINNNPYPSASRLAVPKGKHFQKGDIRCPYCGFEAKSVREVQFHVNTHMAKSYPCEFCSHIYRSKQAVIKHTEKYHSNEVMKQKANANSIDMHRGLETAVVDDQRSMSNYSSSMTSDGVEIENCFSEVSQSQDSNSENNVNYYSIAAPNNNLYAPGINQHYNTLNDQAFFTSGFGNSLIDLKVPHEFLMLGGAEENTMERVLDICNF